ncbi:MAG TPA: hypothetical protein VHW00_20605 [Thermoanaerobaculia bacterium]|nr:hypothetical protein [Thermoanaerobaculia bacterium]
MNSSPAINAALSAAGAGGTVYLCRSTVYPIQDTIQFTHADQTLLTEGFDTGNIVLSERAWLDINSSALTTAVRGHDVPGAHLKWIQVNGRRGRYGQGNGALIDFGGTTTVSATRSQLIHGGYFFDARGWSVLYVSAGELGCYGVEVSNNDVNTAGKPQAGAYADGISYQCRDGFVTGNYIRDVTDGGIVVFGAPGSVIADNRIEAIAQPMLGGINLVDDGPFVTENGDGDYRGTRIHHNWVSATSKFIHVGIGSGPYVWDFNQNRTPACSMNRRNDGAYIHENTVTGAYMGYGYAVDGVKNWTIAADNVDTATHVYTARYTGCTGLNAIPGRFQKYSPRSQGTFLPPFTEAILDSAVSVTY